MTSSLGLRDALAALEQASVDELSFSLPYAPVWLALGVVALVVVGVAFGRRRPRLSFSRTEALFALAPRSSALFVVVARTSWLLAAALTLVAALRPTAPGEPDPDRVDGIDLVVVLDISGSMRAVDVKPNDRLAVAKRVIAEHLLTRENDRIGLVIFAGEAFTQAPLTHDRRLVGQILDGVRTGVIADGTAIGDALATGVNRLRDSEAKGRAIILLTDGDNNAGNLSPESSAELAREMGLPVFPILIGRSGRTNVPTGGKDVLGMPTYQQVVMAVNPELMQRIADVTGGRFFTAASPRELETSFQRILSEMEKTRLEAGPVVRQPVDLGPLLLVPALLFLLLALVLSTTRASTVP